MIIYFDNCATTQVDSEINEIVARYNSINYFNPSALYEHAVSVRTEIEKARKSIACNLGCKPEQIIFTSCGTESINFSINSCAKLGKGNIISTLAEHSAVYNSLAKYAQQVKYAPINNDGTIIIDKLLSLIDKETNLVVLSHTNGQTGGINDIATIAKIIKQTNKEIQIIIDGVQSVGKIPVELNALDIDYYSVSGHKLHAPKGIGLLFAKNAKRLSPLLLGGGQENNLRSGTENVSGIIALSHAIKTSINSINILTPLFNSFTNIILNKLNSKNIDYINLSPTGSAHMLCICFANINGEVIQHILEVNDIIIGISSACTSKNKTNRVISSLGLPSKYQKGLIRISYSKYNDLSQVQFLAEELAKAVFQLSK